MTTKLSTIEQLSLPAAITQLPELAVRNHITEQQIGLTELEEILKTQDRVLVVGTDGSLTTPTREEFLPPDIYLIHFNIATAQHKPHIEPLPNGHNTTSTVGLCMIEGQKQYPLEMEAGVICVLENGVVTPKFVGTVADFGDRTPRIDETGRTYKTWTHDIKNGGSTGMSTTWMAVDNWQDTDQVTVEYWVNDSNGETILHTPEAPANSLKLWGERLGQWVAQYPSEKLTKLGIQEGKPFLLSTGQILFEDDGARALNPQDTPTFTARAVMKIGDGREIETILSGTTSPRNEDTFAPTYPSFAYYD